MKKIFFLQLFLIAVDFLIFISCQKEISWELSGNIDKPPIALAGPDQVITLSTDSILLNGSASSDPDGTISESLWTKVQGPASFEIVHRNDLLTSVRNLVAGVYQFELKIKDNGGLVAKDTVQVTVNTLANRPPVANAGADTTITLPANCVNLDGSGSIDPDNNITGYEWTKLSGLSCTIANANRQQAQVTGLAQGVYQFQLTVTDNGGLFSKDTIQVTVNAQPPPRVVCDNSNRPLINARLIPVGTLSQERGDITVASAGNKILFAGGYIGSQDYSTVDIYDVATNTWSTAELSFARAWIGAVTAGSKIFFAGGQYDDGGTAESSNVVDIYDVSTNTWTVSHLSRGADGLAAATAGNKVFFAGGNWGAYAVNTVDVYDLVTNTWSTASLTVPRNFITAVSTNNKAYFTGGDPWTGQMCNVIDIYDAGSDTWSTSTLQISRGYHAAIAINDILYFAGGATGYGSSETCSVETLSTNTGARALMNLSGPASWLIDAGQNAVAKDNKIIFLRQDGTVYANWFDIYDTQSNTWSIGVLPEPIPAGASVISANNSIYVAGGSVNGALSTQVWKLEF